MSDRDDALRFELRALEHVHVGVVHAFAPFLIGAEPLEECVVAGVRQLAEALDQADDEADDLDRENDELTREVNEYRQGMQKLLETFYPDETAMAAFERFFPDQVRQFKVAQSLRAQLIEPLQKQEAEIRSKLADVQNRIIAAAQHVKPPQSHHRVDRKLHPIRRSGDP